MRLDIPAGIETRLQRLIDHPSRERIAAGILAVGIVAYAITALMLTRGVVPTSDEVSFFAAVDGFDPSSFFDPHNGHLIAVTRLIWAINLELFGVDHLPIRVSMIVAVAATAVVLFLLLRRRLGGLVAVCPVLVVLFCGATPIALQPFVMMFAQACAFGLAAYLVLERDGRWCNPVACILLVLSVLTIEVGVAFAFGALIWLLLDGRKGLSRSWVAIVPLAVYGAWYVWAPPYDAAQSDVFNIVLFPSYAANAAAAGAGALSGLAVDFVDAAKPAALDIGWGRIVLVGIVALIVVRARRDGLSKLQLAVIGALVVLWAAGAVNYGPLRAPEAERYAFTAVVALVLLLGEAYRGARLTPRGLILVLLLTAAALGPNLYLLREQGADLRARSAEVRTRLSVLELAGSNVDPSFNQGLLLPVNAGDYLAAARRYGGGFGGGAASLVNAGPGLGRTADETLASMLGLHLEPSAAASGPGCTTVSGPDLSSGVDLPPGGAVLESDQPTDVRVGRYNPAVVVSVGSMPGGEARALVIPTDSSTVPWQAALPGASRVEACPITSAGRGA